MLRTTPSAYSLSVWHSAIELARPLRRAPQWACLAYGSLQPSSGIFCTERFRALSRWAPWELPLSLRTQLRLVCFGLIVTVMQTCGLHGFALVTMFWVTSRCC